jgi:hypothetical protein
MIDNKYHDTEVHLAGQMSITRQHLRSQRTWFDKILIVNYLYYNLFRILTSGMPITPPLSIASFNLGLDIKPVIASTLGASKIRVTEFGLLTD